MESFVASIWESISIMDPDDFSNFIWSWLESLPDDAQHKLKLFFTLMFFFICINNEYRNIVTMRMSDQFFIHQNFWFKSSAQFSIEISVEHWLLRKYSESWFYIIFRYALDFEARIDCTNPIRKLWILFDMCEPNRLNRVDSKTGIVLILFKLW